MKTAFVITSVIEANNEFPLTYSSTRTAFSAGERFRQTIFTIACMDAASTRDTTIFLLDASSNAEPYRASLSYQKNLRFISVLEEFPDLHKVVREHPNKSHCEALMLLKFFEKYKLQLQEYDYIFKMSGRYFTDGSFDLKICNENNLDKIFFKKAMHYDWVDGYHPPMLDLRTDQQDNTIRMYSSVLYGFGSRYIDTFLDIYHFTKTITYHPNGSIYYMEQMLYFLTRGHANNIVETDWLVYGWDGTNGNFVRY